MKRLNIVLFFAIILAFCNIQAQNNLEKANKLYASGQYSESAKLYELILEKEGVAPEIYFNLGNAYYKMDFVSKSILNYERALRLKPLYDDAKTNLTFAQAKVIDNIVEPPTFFVMKWIDGLIKILGSNQWLFVSLGMFICFLVLGFMFLFANSYSIRKLSFYISIVFISISILTLIFSNLRSNQLSEKNQAIIMSALVVAKSSPDKSGTNLFQLHEGTKVNIKRKLKNWVEIELGNGEIGWVEFSNIETI